MEMTIALGVNFGDYALLAADTRTTYFNWNGSVRKYEDDSEKIQKTTIGLITGAGSTQLLNLVKDRLRNERIIHTNQMLSMVEEARTKYRRAFWRTAERDIEMTVWIFSYMTLKDGRPKLRLDILHPTFGDMFARYEENHPVLIGPHEATEKEVAGISDFLKKKIKLSREFSALSDSIQYHWSIIASLIRKIQPAFPSISSYSQVGVHTLDGFVGVSHILKDDESNVTIKLEKLV